MTTNFIKTFSSNISYSLTSHLLVFFLGIIRAFVVPVMLGVIDFGYWQFYLLYVGFVGIFTFGFNDGIYLRYGGQKVGELPWKKLRGSFCFYIATLCLISIVLFVVLGLVDLSKEKEISFVYIIISISLTGIGSLYIFLFQVTNRIKKYSIYNLIDKLFFLLMLSLVYFYVADYNFKYLMIIDCLSKFFLVVMMSIDCRNHIFGSIESFLVSWNEYYANIGVGIKLMLANLLAMLIISISRFFVEFYFSIEEFSIFAFGLALTNLALIAVNGLSAVLYPAFKQINQEKYKELYEVLSDVITVTIFILFFTYYPIYYIVLNYLPDFKAVLPFFNILLVISLLQIKINLSINTFYKVLRKEKELLKANITCLILVIFLSLLVVMINKKLEFIALATLLPLIYRIYSTDRFIKKLLGSHDNSKLVFEFSLITIFILVTNYASVSLSLFVLLIFFILFIYFQIKHIQTWLNLLKGIR